MKKNPLRERYRYTINRKRSGEGCLGSSWKSYPCYESNKGKGDIDLSFRIILEVNDDSTRRL